MVILCIFACVAITLYLTPKRLAGIASDYASRYLDAKVHVRRISFTLWSTFPHCRLQVDSAVIVSRRLHGLSPQQRALLPANADTLACVKSLHGSVNPLKLLQDRISIRSLHVDGLRLNLVALNDTVNNYNIIPPSSHDRPFVMPQFDVGNATFSNLQSLTYYSAATQAYAAVDLQHCSLKETRRNRYMLTVGGIFGLKVEDLQLLRGFPFAFSGNVDVAFHPFRIDFKKYNVELGNLHSQIDLSMKLGENDSQLTSLHYSVDAFNLMRLFEYLPAGWLPTLECIRSNLTLEASAHLTAPYHFSSQDLPGFRVDFSVPDSWLTYDMKGQPDIHVRNIGMQAHLYFNGHDINASRFCVDRLCLNTTGTDVSLSGEVDNLFGSPCVTADADIHADLGRLHAILPVLDAYRLHGYVHAALKASFPLQSVSNGRMTGIPVDGLVTVSDARATVGATSVRCGGMQMRFSQHNRKLRAEADLNRIEVSGANKDHMTVQKSQLALSVAEAAKGRRTALKGVVNNVEVDAGGYLARARRINFSAITDSLFSVRPGMSVPLQVAVDADTLSAFALTDSVMLDIHSMALRGSLKGAHLHTSVRGNQLNYSDAVNYGVLDHFTAALDLNLYGGMKERGTVMSIIDLLQPSGSLTARQGGFTSVAYPAPVYITALDANLTPAAFRLNKLSVRSQNNALDIAGDIANYRCLLPGGSKNETHPVVVDVDLDIDTVDINRIAGTCREGSRQLARLKGKKITAGKQSADTAATPIRPWLIPRWLQITARLRADECTYTNLHLQDLLAGIRLERGIFLLDSIRTHTDFGSARAAATYTGADSLHMGVKVDVALDTINVVTFFQRFHTLLEMMPQMRNLSGSVSAEVNGEFSLFPTMDMELPTLTADIRAEGQHLQVHQSRFIHRLCRYLLIHTREDLHIHDIKVKATISDNQLRLYPFIFEMDRYKLSFTGENDFAGNLYYHVGVLHSPVPFAFGVNIIGTFSDYHIRFGRPSFRIDNAFHRMQLLQHHRVNMVTELRWLVSKFLDKAVEADRGTQHTRLVDDSGHRLPRNHSQLLLSIPSGNEP